MARHRGTGEMIREGSVYVLQNEALGDDVFKIGMSTVEVGRRASGVARQFRLPGGFRVVFEQPTRDAYQLEARVHRALDAWRVTAAHPLSRRFGLEQAREFFAGLPLAKVRSTIGRAVKGLEIEDSWCRQLMANPNLIGEIDGVGNGLRPDDPAVAYWIPKLAANGSRCVAEFTLRQIARGTKHTAAKTSYLTWRFGGASRAWLDPTYPRAASTLTHRRFDGDLQTWEKLLGPEAIYHEYKGKTEIRLTLWTERHMKALRRMVEEIMPKVQFLT